MKQILTALSFALSIAHAGVVDIHDNQLHIDGKPQPQLFGAEIQYFRLRGGNGRNVPRATVLKLWDDALNRAVEAHMNAVSFYIPWDFHEYAPGKFDFDGTVDEDGDGNPDYPSRDVKTFIKMVVAHGIHNIMVRPGPYINAEWGFLGFGSAPLWFHEAHPESSAINAQGLRNTLYSYTDSAFLAEAKIWIETVYAQVLKPYIGAGLPVSFLQLDNETNFMWQSLYNADYGDRTKGIYRDFLKTKYGSLGSVNAAHNRAWTSFAEIEPPASSGKNLGEDQDWYRFQDETIHLYLEKVRHIWEGLGVREPNVLFTLADSYNAPEDGLLPNFKLHNDPGRTGMMTVNMYPKTYELPEKSLFNNPFKADLDVKSADAAKNYYLGHREEWVLGPEIQTGWWPGIEVTTDARRQTYLTTIGHGLKALFVYYFNEGNDWDYSWTKDQIAPYYAKLHEQDAYKTVADPDLPQSFWSELDDQIHKLFFFTWNTHFYWQQGGTQPAVLKFDAPLGPDAQPRAPFALLKDIGTKIVAPYGDFLGSATEMTDPVCFLKDVEAHAPSPIRTLSSRLVASDFAGGLLGYMLQSGINPRMVFWGLTPPHELDACQLIVYQDNGFTTPEILAEFREVIARGGGILSLLNNGSGPALLTAEDSREHCAPLGLGVDTTGYRCVELNEKGGTFTHVNEAFYKTYNSDDYGILRNVPAQRRIFEQVLSDLKINPRLKIVEGGDRTAIFGRQSPDGQHIFVTLKTGNVNGSDGHFRWAGAFPDRSYAVTDLLAGTSATVTGAQLNSSGFQFHLNGNGSAVFNVEGVKR